MGNCMETCKAGQLAKREEEAEFDQRGEVGSVGKEGGGVKVRILLTRGELEWLMLRLKEGRERRVEDVLMEMRSRERVMREGSRTEQWRPSLESIMEVPEVQSFGTAAS